jgi:rare lipoprotein A
MRLNLWLVTGLLIWGCSTHTPPPAPPGPPGYPKPYKALGEWYQPLPHARGFSETGIASWYGEDFHGKRTSSGETYNMYALSAAHKTLPLGTWVRVVNLNNNRTLDVRINDRGPFVRGRIIDLSYAAAKELRIVGPGTAPVEIVALGAAEGSDDRGSRSYIPLDYYSGNFTFQVGAFLDRQNAERFAQKLAQTYPNTHIARYDNGRQVFYRVRVGRCTTLEQAQQYESDLVRSGYPDAFTIAE